MIKGIGIDIIELDRIRASLNKSDRLARRILTERELEKFYSLPSKRRQAEFAAGRFAAKEACAKALGTGIGKLSFQHIEVENDSRGAPGLRVEGYEKEAFFLSISHSRQYAVAQVIVQGESE
jgi:holo-[acyl-carrier protein] synthase